MTYAIIDSAGLVINTIVWDGKPPWKPPSGCIAVKVPADSNAGIGWTYVDGQFIPPAEP